MPAFLRPRRVPRSVAFWAFAGLALLVSHDAIWIVQLGPGEGLAEAMRSSGHGYWAAVSVGIVAAAAIVAGARLARVVALRRRAAAMPARSVAVSGYAERVIGTWIRLVVVVAIGFAIQENVEHFFVHSHLPGIGALLGTEYPLALPVIATISAIAAALAAALTAIEHALVASIAAQVDRRQTRAPRGLARPPRGSRHPVPSPLARAGASRAPPPLLVSQNR